MNLAAMVDEVGRAVSASVSRSLAPITRQVEELLAWRKSVGELRNGIDGKDAPAVDIDAIVAKVLPLVPRGTNGDKGEPGKDAPAVDIEEVVSKTLARIPVPKNGEPGSNGEKGDPGPRGEAAVLLLGEGPPLAPGKSGDVYFDTATGDVYRCS